MPHSTPEKRKSWYDRNKEKYLAYNKKKRQEARRVRVEWKKQFVELKGGKCVDCGYSAHLAALEFDHVRGVKRAAIASMVNQHCRLTLVLEELEKCELVCSNCHQIRTHNRRLQKRENNQ